VIIYTKRQCKKYIAIALFFVIIINNKYKGNKSLLNHEKIHLQQQRELLWLPFFIWYAVEFVINYFKYKNWHSAYKNISFEKEAYCNEHDLSYLKTRKYFSFVKYF